MENVQPSAPAFDCEGFNKVALLLAADPDTKGGIKFLLANAERLKIPESGPASAGIRFSVIFWWDNRPMIEIPGWRVQNGELLPPMRRVGRGYVPMLRLRDTGVHSMLVRMLQVWAPFFPDVRFPLGGDCADVVADFHKV